MGSGRRGRNERIIDGDSTMDGNSFDDGSAQRRTCFDGLKYLQAFYKGRKLDPMKAVIVPNLLIGWADFVYLEKFSQIEKCKLGLG